MLGGGFAVVVIDDGSIDDTANAALAAGADVLSLRRNRGKGGAVAAGVEITPEAEAYLLWTPILAAPPPPQRLC